MSTFIKRPPLRPVGEDLALYNKMPKEAQAYVDTLNYNPRGAAKWHNPLSYYYQNPNEYWSFDPQESLATAGWINPPLYHHLTPASMDFSTPHMLEYMSDRASTRAYNNYKRSLHPPTGVEDYQTMPAGKDLIPMPGNPNLYVKPYTAYYMSEYIARNGMKGVDKIKASDKYINPFVPWYGSKASQDLYKSWFASLPATSTEASGGGQTRAEALAHNKRVRELDRLYDAGYFDSSPADAPYWWIHPPEDAAGAAGTAGAAGASPLMAALSGQPAAPRVARTVQPARPAPDYSVMARPEHRQGYKAPARPARTTGALQAPTVASAMAPAMAPAAASTQVASAAPAFSGGYTPTSGSTRLPGAYTPAGPMKQAAAFTAAGVKPRMAPATYKPRFSLVDENPLLASLRSGAYSKIFS